MRVTSVFFADHVAIYESKLFVQGGVFDYFTVSGVPAEHLMELAIILQSDEGDRGVSRRVRVEMRGPDSSVVIGANEVAVGLPPESELEHFSIAMKLPVRFATPGRHVTQVMVDGEPQAAAPFRLDLA